MARKKHVHQSLWWRGEVRLEGNTIIPLTFKPYNPFAEYFPYESVKTRRQRSLYHRFTDVKGTDSQAVAAFCQEFGVLGNPFMTWEKWNQASPLLQRVTTTQVVDDELSARSQSKRGKTPHESLCVQMTLGEFQLEQSAMRGALRHLEESTTGKTARRRQEAQELLSEQVTGELTKIGQRPIWDKRQKGWVYHWDTLSLVSVMYLMLYLDLQGPGRNLQCPKCGKAFLAEHPRSEYCSPQCQNAAKVARHRLLIKQRDRQELRGKGKEP